MKQTKLISLLLLAVNYSMYAVEPGPKQKKPGNFIQRALEGLKRKTPPTSPREEEPSSPRERAIHLIQAIHDGNFSKVQEYILKGVEINYVQASGDTPLITAINKVILTIEPQTGMDKPIAHQNYTIISLLLRSGADVNAHGMDGETPLLRAIQGNNKPIMRMLIEAGANPTLTNDEGKDAFTIAQEIAKEKKSDIDRALHEANIQRQMKESPRARNGYRRPSP